VEVLGFLNPLTKEKQLKTERIKYWLSVGAQPSDTIHNLLVSEKIIEGKMKKFYSEATLLEQQYVKNPDITKIAGYEGIICGLSAIYLSMAEVINETYGKTILPVGRPTIK